MNIYFVKVTQTLHYIFSLLQMQATTVEHRWPHQHGKIHPWLGHYSSTSQHRNEMLRQESPSSSYCTPMVKFPTRRALLWHNHNGTFLCMALKYRRYAGRHRTNTGVSTTDHHILESQLWGAMDGCATHIFSNQREWNAYVQGDNIFLVVLAWFMIRTARGKYLHDRGICLFVQLEI